MNNEEFKNHLREGIFHEIGHIIATMVCFPCDDRLKCMQMKLNTNGSYGIAAVWNEDIKFNYHTQLNAFTNVSLAGGIFQQMVNYYSALQNNGLKYSLLEKCISLFNPNRALYFFLKRKVQYFIKGMEIDFDTLFSVYERLHMRLDNEKAKCNAIKILLPFIGKSEIQQLCEYCLNVFWEGGQDRKPIVEIDIDTIQSFINPLNCGRLNIRC